MAAAIVRVRNNPVVAGCRFSFSIVETPRHLGCKNLAYRRKPVSTVVGREFTESGFRFTPE